MSITTTTTITTKPRYSRLLELCSLLTRKPIIRDKVLYWRGNVLIHDNHWVYAMPVEFKEWMGEEHPKLDYVDMVTAQGECHCVRPLELSEVHSVGVVYGLLVERYVS